MSTSIIIDDTVLYHLWYNRSTYLLPEVGLEDLLLLQMIILNLGDEGEKDSLRTSFAVRKSKPLFLCHDHLHRTLILRSVKCVYAVHSQM